jgi:hypothetical protein
MKTSSAFNGDSFIENEVRRLTQAHSIKTIVETGTYLGETTIALASMAPHVLTIENDWQRYCEASHLSVFNHVISIHGDSAQTLRIMSCQLQGPVLYYLDAHWGAHSPLLDELDAIPAGPSNPVIAIHDFQNPNHPEYTHDHWDIGVYRLELVTAAFNKIYGNNFWHHWFNDQSDAKPPRGILYAVCASSG